MLTLRGNSGNHATRLIAAAETMEAVSKRQIFDAMTAARKLDHLMNTLQRLTVRAVGLRVLTEHGTYPRDIIH